MTPSELDALLTRAFRAWSVPQYQRAEMTDEWAERFLRFPAEVLSRALVRAEEVYPDRLPSPIQLARIVKSLAGEGHGAYQPAQPPRDEPLTPERAAAESRYWREQAETAATDRERGAATHLAAHFAHIARGEHVEPIPTAELLRLFGVGTAPAPESDAQRVAARKAELRRQAGCGDADTQGPR